MKIYRVADTMPVMYHGSDSESFEGEIRMNERDSGWFGAGFYVSAYPNIASIWGKNIYKVKIPTGKMAKVTAESGFKNIQYLGEAQDANEFAGGTKTYQRSEYEWSNKFTEFLKEKGYIGVSVEVDGWDNMEVVIFDPSTIQILEKVHDRSEFREPREDKGSQDQVNQEELTEVQEDDQT
jgi:hypothetical protein